MTLREYLENWLSVYVVPLLAPSTAAGYRSALAHVSAATMGTELDQVTPMQLQGEINATAAKAPRQAQILFVALSSALWKAQKLGLVSLSPMRLCDKPTHRKREIVCFTAAEAAAYVRALEGDPCRPALLLMLCLGLRRNEARAVRPCDVDAEGVLHIRQQRRGDQLLPLKSSSSSRDIPLPEALRALFRIPDGEYLCQASETGLRRAHLRAMAAAGIGKPVTLHGLRHTCATLAIQDGAALSTVQRLLGHRHSSITADFYIHPELRSIGSAVSVLCSSLSLAS